MKSPHRKPYIEILPAALLSQRQTWQETARSLPAGAYFLVTDPKNEPQTQLMLELAQSFREQGRWVTVWPNKCESG
jgi:hypothetical protein